MIRQSALLGALLIIMVACGGTSAASTKPPTTSTTTPAATASGQAVTVGKPEWAGSDGLLAVVVPIQNPDPKRWMASSPYSLTIKDASGSILAVQQNVVTLPPDGSSWIVETGVPVPDVAAVASVDVQLTPKMKSTPYPGPTLTIVQQNLGPGQNQILGSVKNDGPSKAGQIRIIGIFRDASGAFIGAADGYAGLEQGGVAACMTVTFQSSFSGDTSKRSPSMTYQVQAIPQLVDGF